ncbi:chromosome partition protein Smc-like [Physella acuta]|uniref:chromosome partition protein Smc-like n=1 Tax=Physella acuta TaxID=109671 RepID=UPI0027DB9E29|nr:chromosome partition protein Smc-like [Physella acuta]XP_059164466.1 chromosome partition protein Smc-like [Physella acuta]
MRPKIQVKLVTEHMRYLEEKIQVLEPAISVIKKALEKSQSWIEDKNDNPSITYIELCQELDSATTAMLGAASQVMHEYQHNEDVEDRTPYLPQSRQQSTATEKLDLSESKQKQTEILSRLEQIETAISSLQDVSRLEQIETAISSLQDVSRLEQIERAISSLQDVSRLEQIETAISSLQDVSRLEQIETVISSLQDVSRLEQIETAISSLQDVSRLEQIETAISSLQDVSRLEQIETAISSLQDVSRLEQIETAISSLQDVSRLEQIETAILSLQDANDKSTDDISEIKQWRDNFVSEQSDMWLNIEQLTKKQKRNFKNIIKQMSEQDNKIKELNKEIESLKEKETKSNKTLEKLSLDMKEYENNAHKINKEMQDHTDKIDSIAQEIERHSDQIVSLQKDNNKIMVDSSTKLEKVQSKHNVMYKLLQQRLMPIDKLIQIFNQNLQTGGERLQKLKNIENTISKLSKEFHLIETRVCQPYICHIQLQNNTTVTTGSTLCTFKKVWEPYGSYFNRTTGKLVAPDDGFYLVIVTLQESEDKLIKIGVYGDDRFYKNIFVKSANTSAAGSTIVDMKKGQELYFKVGQADDGAKIQGGSGFTILRL